MERNPLNNHMTETRKQQQDQQQRMSEKMKRKYLCNVWLDQQWLKTCFFLLFFALSWLWFFITDCFEFVGERWVCSMRVFIEFRTQRVHIFAFHWGPNPVFKTMMWNRWFSKASNKQLFPFVINLFIILPTSRFSQKKRTPHM